MSNIFSKKTLRDALKRANVLDIWIDPIFQSLQDLPEAQWPDNFQFFNEEFFKTLSSFTSRKMTNNEVKTAAFQCRNLKAEVAKLMDQTTQAKPTPKQPQPNIANKMDVQQQLKSMTDHKTNAADVDFIDILEQDSNARTEAALIALKLVQRMGASSKVYEMFQKGLIDEEDMLLCVHQGVSAQTVTKHVNRLVAFEEYVSTHFNTTLWDHDQAGSYFVQFLKSIWKDLRAKKKEKQAAKKGKRFNTGKCTIKNYIEALDWAEENLEIFIDRILPLEQALKKIASKELATKVNKALPYTNEDLITLEMIAHQELEDEKKKKISYSDQDRFFACCRLLDVYCVKRLANAQALDQDDVEEIVQGKRVWCIRDKCDVEKSYQIDSTQFIWKSWIHLLSELNPPTKRNFLIPEPHPKTGSKAYTGWKNKALSAQGCRTWMKRLFRKAGYNKEEQERVSRVTAAKCTLPSALAAADLAPYIQAFGQWKDNAVALGYAATADHQGAVKLKALNHPARKKHFKYSSF